MTGLTAELDLLIVPLICAAYTACSLDKSNLGNAKQLGLMKDIGEVDKDGSKYAFLNSLYCESHLGKGRLTFQSSGMRLL